MNDFIELDEISVKTEDSIVFTLRFPKWLYDIVEENRLLNGFNRSAYFKMLVLQYFAKGENKNE